LCVGLWPRQSTVFFGMLAGGMGIADALERATARVRELRPTDRVEPRLARRAPPSVAYDRTGGTAAFVCTVSTYCKGGLEALPQAESAGDTLASALTDVGVAVARAPRVHSGQDLVTHLDLFLGGLGSDAPVDTVVLYLGGRGMTSRARGREQTLFMADADAVADAGSGWVTVMDIMAFVVERLPLGTTLAVILDGFVQEAGLGSLVTAVRPPDNVDMYVREVSGSVKSKSSIPNTPVVCGMFSRGVACAGGPALLPSVGWEATALPRTVRSLPSRRRSWRWCGSTGQPWTWLGC
jgi:hypothetical protein